MPNSFYQNHKNFEPTKLGRFEDMAMGELRALNAKYADPLTLNFKLMINYDKPYGLFAPEENVNSALAYLKRIGQTVRYEMLKNWIGIVQIFMRDFDFLMLQAEGFEVVQNWKPGLQFTEDERVNFLIRETSDMLVQSILTNYRYIWFDDIRNVEVLPINLRRFDVTMLVYASGYYNMMFYDNEYGTWDIEKMIFPTIRKLSTEVPDMRAFHHHLYTLGDCWINNEESGKNFTANIQNEQNADFIKNNLTLNFRFGRYSGQFNAISGAVNYGALLAATAAFSDESQAVENIKKTLKDQLDDAKKSLVASTVKTLKTRVDQLEGKLLSKYSVIGDLWSKVSVDYAQQMVKNTIDLGINKVQEMVIDNPLTQLNNLVNLNFANNLYDLVKNNTSQKPGNSTKLLTNSESSSIYEGEGFNPGGKLMVKSGTSFGEYNVYDGGF